MTHYITPLHCAFRYTQQKQKKNGKRRKKNFIPLFAQKFQSRQDGGACFSWGGVRYLIPPFCGICIYIPLLLFVFLLRSLFLLLEYYHLLLSKGLGIFWYILVVLGRGVDNSERKARRQDVQGQELGWWVIVWRSWLFFRLGVLGSEEVILL